MNKKPKTYTKEDMDQAIENLRDQKMSLTKASEIFKIPDYFFRTRFHILWCLLCGLDICGTDERQEELDNLTEKSESA